MCFFVKRVIERQTLKIWCLYHKVKDSSDILVNLLRYYFIVAETIIMILLLYRIGFYGMLNFLIPAPPPHLTKQITPFPMPIPHVHVYVLIN